MGACKADLLKNSRNSDLKYLTSRDGIAELLKEYPSLNDIIAFSGNTDLIALKVDLEEAWNRDDLLTDREKYILYQLYIHGLSAEELAVKMGCSRQNINQLKNTALSKLLDDMNGYETDTLEVADDNTVE